jgi:Chaperone of endosialidase
MEGASEGLGKLRPVTFRYKAEHANAPRQLEYGLIAEEVAEIYPELVTTNAQGEPTGVR